MPMGVPKMWEEGRLKVEPARENTCWEEQTLASLRSLLHLPRLHCAGTWRSGPECRPLGQRLT